jgi:translation initiation factor RLI1
LAAARAIRSLVTGGDDGARTNYVICVEHDLAVLDYLSDFICVLYGKPVRLLLLFILLLLLFVVLVVDVCF